jgi:hypothetical protein
MPARRRTKWSLDAGERHRGADIGEEVEPSPQHSSEQPCLGAVGQPDSGKPDGAFQRRIGIADTPEVLNRERRTGLFIRPRPAGELGQLVGEADSIGNGGEDTERRLNDLWPDPVARYHAEVVCQGAPH